MDARSIEALRRPGAWPHAVAGVTLIETHISWVFLTGEYAYKIKKPVDFGFLDFSTLEKRRHCCEEEVRLNRRLAPNLYLGVLAVSGPADRPVIGGDGEVLDYAVRMRQFDTDAGFDRLLARGELTPDHIDQAAQILADFHAAVAVAAEDSGFGTPLAVTGPVGENFEQIRTNIEAQIEDRAVLAQFERLERWSLAACDAHEPGFQERLAAGFVRECHGDLHLRNIVLIEGDVVPFDCIEFNAALRWIDVMSELAFLLMDLDDHGRGDLSGRLLNGYLEFTGDYAGLELLRFYQVYRAMVRAKVESLRLAQIGNDDADMIAEMTRYLALATDYTRASPPRLIIAHGLSGSGKTYVSQQLLERTPLIRLRSDVERKRLFGLSPLEPSGSKRDAGIYTVEANTRTYDRLLDLAKLLLGAGWSVLVDAAFLKREERDQFHSLAREVGVSFAIMHCEADIDVQRERVAARTSRADDASEADLAILNRQLETEEPLAADERSHTITIDTTGELDLAPLLSFLESRDRPSPTGVAR